MVTLVTGGKISGNLSLGSSSGSTLVLDGTGTQAISKAVTGSIQNSGSLTKQGTGTWILDKGLSAPISTSVQVGVLVVDSTLSTPVVNVHAGGTLAGFGTVTGSVINSGIVARRVTWKYPDVQSRAAAGRHTRWQHRLQFGRVCD
jgi:hypothetical protein